MQFEMHVLIKGEKKDFVSFCCYQLRNIKMHLFHCKARAWYSKRIKSQDTTTSN